MSLQEAASSLNRRKPRGTKKSLRLVETNADLHLHAEVHPPLRQGAQHTVTIKRGTQGIICGPAPNGGDGHVVAFEFGRHHTATAVVTSEQVMRI